MLQLGMDTGHFENAHGGSRNFRPLSPAHKPNLTLTLSLTLTLTLTLLTLRLTLNMTVLTRASILGALGEQSPITFLKVGGLTDWSFLLTCYALDRQIAA